MSGSKLSARGFLEPDRTIYVDASPLADRYLTGVGRYTARLALALAAARGPVRFFSLSEEIHAPEDLDWSQDQDLAAWGRRVWRGRPEPLESPPPGSVGVYPFLRPTERRFSFEVSVLHDFTPLIVPYTHAETTIGQFQGFFGQHLLSSDRALAVSHSTKADAAWLTDMDPDRVAVAHSGPSLCVGRHAHQKPVRRTRNVGLVVSTLEPRKNALFLLDWFYDTKALPEDTELWWVGPLGWLTSRRSLKRYRRPSGRRRVRFLGVVSDANLCKLYQTAAWSIYPSLYEGFGFPVLDALRHGTPVLASGNSALREFDSPGLFFFDPCDAATVDRAWAEYQAAGPIAIPRADLDRHYSWDRVARTLLGLAAPSRTRAEAA